MSPASEPASENGKRRRLIEVDRVTGFAIVLVVIGHIVARSPPAGNEWYVALKFNIYQFHMPLFMFMSGLVFQHTYTSISTAPEFWDWARKKIARLAPGFLLVGTAIVIGKALTGDLIHVDNLQDDALSSFFRLFTAPTESVAASLWYIYVLLEFYLLFPLLLIVCRNRRAVILAIVIALHIVHLSIRVPRVFALHSICEFALYFWIGAMCCEHYDRMLDFVRRHGKVLVVVFAASFATGAFMWWRHSGTIIGLASIPAVLYVVGTNTGSIGRIFAYVSQYTFVIYLLNTIAIGVTKGAMLKLLPWDGVNFVLYFLVLTIAGIAGPALAHKWVFSRNKTLSRIMN